MHRKYIIMYIIIRVRILTLIYWNPLACTYQIEVSASEECTKRTVVYLQKG